MILAVLTFSVLICDCGGGTVDITTYAIQAVGDEPKYEELVVGAGGKCGSTYGMMFSATY
jgi:hypothetical protein